jgi:hypothetical protein
LNGELDRQIPLYLLDYNDQLDATDLNLDSPATTKVNVDAQCEAKMTEARNKFTLLQASLNVQKDGMISASILATSLSKLESGLKLGKKEKLSKYDEVVSMYNKALLTSVLIPVIDIVSRLTPSGNGGQINRNMIESAS